MLDFPLSFAQPLLAGLSAPAANFRPDSDWKSRFRTHCLVGNAKLLNGRFEIARTASAGGSLLRIRYERSRGAARVQVLTFSVLPVGGPTTRESRRRPRREE